MAEGSAKSARAVAMDLLARREHSPAELRTKLATRGFDADEIDAALGGLSRDGLADESRFIEAFVASRIRKGYGPGKIRAELIGRGIAAQAAAEGLAGAGDWIALARTVREKRFGATLPGDFRERARQMRFLEYRGFTGEQIRSCFDDE